MLLLGLAFELQRKQQINAYIDLQLSQHSIMFSVVLVSIYDSIISNFKKRTEYYFYNSRSKNITWVYLLLHDCVERN